MQDDQAVREALSKKGAYGADIDLDRYEEGSKDAEQIDDLRDSKYSAYMEKVGVIADEMKLGGTTDDEKVKLLIEHLRGMNDALNIPHCIQHYGPDSYPAEQGFVPENVFLERLPEIAKNAIADACTGSNPRQPSQEEMEKLLKCCYYDTDVDF